MRHVLNATELLLCILCPGGKALIPNKWQYLSTSHLCIITWHITLVVTKNHSQMSVVLHTSKATMFFFHCFRWARALDLGRL